MLRKVDNRRPSGGSAIASRSEVRETVRAYRRKCARSQQSAVLCGIAYLGDTVPTLRTHLPNVERVEPWPKGTDLPLGVGCYRGER